MKEEWKTLVASATARKSKRKLGRKYERKNKQDWKTPAGSVLG